MTTYHIFERSLGGSDQWNYRGTIEAAGSREATDAAAARLGFGNPDEVTPVRDVRDSNFVLVADSNLNKIGWMT